MTYRKYINIVEAANKGCPAVLIGVTQIQL